MKEKGVMVLPSLELPKLPLGDAIEWFVRWLIKNLSVIFDFVSDVLSAVSGALSDGLLWVHPVILIIIFSIIIWLITNKLTAILSAIGLALVWNMGLWPELVDTLVLVVVGVAIALVIGIPTGILMTRSRKLEGFMRPILDFMQTMPPFVYLIPAAMLFGIGVVPGLFATVIFAIPPPVRLTYLGITQVPLEMKEMSIAFGANDRQVLRKVELPLALPSIMAGVNQCIMLGISMVVIASMIGARGLGEVVLYSLSRLDLSLGFESGLAIVILAMVLDRMSRNVGSGKQTPLSRLIEKYNNYRKQKKEENKEEIEQAA
ncbi:MAG: proline/glycine betaine ABC transporter permease [Dehalococcoidales bacterium]|jgi:glycine betaine/proline transport system permease protein|nr:proline/glycine betaine ABC transporter permease [Dehalococcoidales bacterium]